MIGLSHNEKKHTAAQQLARNDTKVEVIQKNMLPPIAPRQSRDRKKKTQGNHPSHLEVDAKSMHGWYNFARMCITDGIGRPGPVGTCYATHLFADVPPNSGVHK